MDKKQQGPKTILEKNKKEEGFMSHEVLMFALQGLSEPYLENHLGGRDASIKLSREEAEDIISQRLKHKTLPKTTREKLLKMSNEYFGEGAELPYAEEGVNGLEEKIHVVAMAKKK